MDWDANPEEITNIEMEEAFAKHIDNNPRWPMPYFAMASDALIKKF